MKKTAILIALVVLLSLCAAADDKPNFSGKWVLDKGQSDFGDFPSPDSQTNVIEHKEPDIKLTQTVKGDAIPGGEATTERHYTTDGKENVNHLGPAEVKSTSKWDGSKLITVAKLETPNGTVEIKDSWELAESGKQFIINRNFKSQGGERNQKLVFNKQ